MGEAIYAAVNQPKDFFELRGDHNAAFYISRQAYIPGLDQFIESVLGPIRNDMDSL
jgi:hypothetical protein